MTTGNTGTTTIDGENLQELIDNYIDSSIDGSGNGIFIDTTGEIKKTTSAGPRTIPNANNVGEFTDLLIKKGKTKIASILEMSEELTQAPSTPIGPDLTFNDFTDIYTKILVPPVPTTPADPPVHPLHRILHAYLGNTEYLTTTDIAITADKTSLDYKIGGTSNGPIGIIEMCEELYLTRRIEIKNMTQVAAKCQRAKLAAERTAERQRRLGESGGSSSFGGNAPSTLNVTPNDELNPYAIEAACQKAKASPGSAGYYGFDGKYFTIKYDKVARVFTAEYQDKEGNKQTTTGSDSATIVTDILKLAQKKEEKKETVELDMKDEFDEYDFHDFCDEVSKAKKHKGVLIVHGHKFSVRDHHGHLAVAFTDHKGEHRHKKGTKEKLYKILKNEIHKLHEHSPAHNHVETAGGHEKHETKETKKEHGDKPKDKKKEHAETEGHEKGHAKEEKKAHVGFFGKIRDSIKETLKVLWTPVPGVAKAGLRSGIVGGVLLGTSAVLSSAAVASAIVPAMSMTFVGSSVWSLVKWIKNQGKKEGGDDKAGHAHGGGH